MTQTYRSQHARDRMSDNNCPECGEAPEQHLDSAAFWLPRSCDLARRGVLDRIAAFRDQSERGDNPDS